MTIKTIFFLLTVALVSSCKPSDDYNINYEGDKLVVNGIIQANIGVTVALSKSQSPIGKISTDGFNVKKGRVWLYQNDTLVAEMTINANGKFTINSFKPQAGKSYRLKAVAESLDTVESLPVVMPDAPTINSFVLRGDSTNRVNQSRGAILFSVNLKDNGSEKNFYHLDSYVQISKDSIYNYYLKGLKPGYAACEFYALSNVITFTDKCFNGKDFKVDYTSEHEKQGTIVIELSGIDKSFFLLMDSYDQPVGIDLGFSEPKLAVSNIKNGYGVFYAKNTKTFTLKLN
jgi:Domain of unknown function (DUF4249)